MTVSIIYIDPQTVVAVGVILGKVAIDVILILCRQCGYRCTHANQGRRYQYSQYSHGCTTFLAEIYFIFQNQSLSI